MLPGFRSVGGRLLNPTLSYAPDRQKKAKPGPNRNAPRVSTWTGWGFAQYRSRSPDERESIYSGSLLFLPVAEKWVEN